jgi:hypothetical protein
VDLYTVDRRLSAETRQMLDRYAHIVMVANDAIIPSDLGTHMRWVLSSNRQLLVALWLVKRTTSETLI